MNLTTKTVQGVGWSGTSQIIRLLLHLGIIAILARLLTPNDFGLLAMVIVFTNFVMIFRDFGLGAALIQYKKLTEEHLSSIFWINVFTGFLLTLLLAALAPVIAYFYGENKLTPIAIVLASTFFISSFGIVQTALFKKELKFKHLAIIEILAVVISGSVAITMAFSGFGVWSLVGQQVIFSFVMVNFLWSFPGWRPKILFQWQKVKELFGFGLNLTGFNFINYFNRNLDDFLIGKFLGSALLGFYNLAYQFLLFPSIISSIIGRVMFPSLSAIQNDKSKTRYAYIKATRYIAILSFPLMMGLLLLAPQFIMVVFGPQWGRSIFLVQILALVGLVQSIVTTIGWIYNSQGRTDIQLRWGIFATIIVTAAFIIGLHWNLEGVVIAYAIAQIILLYPALAIPFKIINLKVGYFVKRFKTIFLATAEMGGIIFIISFFMKNILGASDIVILILTTLIGIVTYAGLLFILDKSLYQEVFQLLKQLKPSSSTVVEPKNYDSKRRKL